LKKTPDVHLPLGEIDSRSWSEERRAEGKKKNRVPHEESEDRKALELPSLGRLPFVIFDPSRRLLHVAGLSSLHNRSIQNRIATVLSLCRGVSGVGSARIHRILPEMVGLDDFHLELKAT
jgi:hypothetical protein